MSKDKKILVISFQSLTKNSAGGMARLGFFLSRRLHAMGLLESFIIYSKGKFDTSFPSKPVSGKAKYILFVLNKINQFIKLPEHSFRLLQEHIYDILCVHNITPSIGVILTTNAHMKRTFRKAKKYNIPIVYIPANPEEHFIERIVNEENDKLNIKSVDAYTYKPRLRFYDQSIKYVDTIIGTYPTVYSTYKSADIQAELVQINGHLKPDFNPYKLEDSAIAKPMMVVFVATTIVLKGLQYLLEAWKSLKIGHPDIRIELYIVGRIEEKLKDYLDAHYADLKDVKYLGRVPDVGAALKDKDIAVVPSLTDGGPYTALEAAHYGLPVIITENCGSAELLSRNNGCKIIPIRDANSIKAELLWAYNNREEAKEIGIRAKEILDNYDQEEFINDVALYLKNKLYKQDNIS